MADSEKTLDEIMQGRFIRRVLRQESKDINQVQVRYMSGKKFSADTVNSRSFKVEDNALAYAQKYKHRFMDMKHIRKGKRKQRVKKKAHPIYNKILYGHYNNIVRELKYGYTDAAKEELKKLEE